MSRLLRAALALVGMSSTATLDGLGQTSATFDAGGTHVDYEGPGSSGALTFSPGISIERFSTTVDAVGRLSRFGTGDWSLQAGIEGSYFTPAYGYLQGELGASFDASGQAGIPTSSALLGGARLHFSGDGRGVWVGGELGTANDGDSSRVAQVGDLGAWARLEPVTLLVQVEPWALGQSWRYTDAQGVARFELGRLEVSTLVGVRYWTRPAGVANRMWGSLNGTYWLGDHLAITAGGGTYLADYGQGFPGGGYVSLAVRFATQRPSTRQAVSQTADHPMPPLTRSSGPRFEAIRQDEPGRWRLQFHDPSAVGVEIMGDFTDWKPVELTPEGEGRWAVSLPIAPGPHRMNLRVNGGEWSVPPGMPIVTDEFSGTVGVLVVQGKQ